MEKPILLLWVVIGLLVVLGVGMVLSFYSFTQQTLAPITDTTNTLRTQVAKVLHPTPTILPDPVTIINEVRSLARLETIQYSVEKIITAETGQEVFGPLFGDRLLFVAHGVPQGQRQAVYRGVWGRTPTANGDHRGRVRGLHQARR